MHILSQFCLSLKKKHLRFFYFNPGETKLIKTGIAMELPEGYAGLIYARSGLATKRGLAPANKVGVIDSDYRGEIMVALHNHTNEVKEIDAYEKENGLLNFNRNRNIFKLRNY